MTQMRVGSFNYNDADSDSSEGIFEAEKRAPKIVEDELQKFLNDESPHKRLHVAY